MKPVVEIAFDLNASGAGDFLTLDEPVKGKLDDATYPLAGLTLVDVSDFVRQVDITRGRPKETQQFDAGTCTVALDNRTRQFDPSAPASVSPYAAGIVPRKELVVSLGAERIFTGQVEDWDISYEQINESITYAKAADAFTLFSQEIMDAGVGPVGLSGSVVNQVLSASAIDWPASRRDIDAGLSTIGANTIPADQSALSYLQKIATGEPGAFFVGRQGYLTFRERLDLQTPTGVEFRDDGSGTPFATIDVEFGTENLFTRVEVDWVGGTVTAQNDDAIVKYGLTTLTVETLLSTQAEAENFAVFYAERYAEPTYRIRGLSVNMDLLTSAQQLAISRLELADNVAVEWTPSGVGDPVRRVVIIDEIIHEFTPKPEALHFVRLNFSQTLAAFILDSTIQGKLDENYLGW